MLKIAYSSIYKYALPPGHRFPMIKYELLPEQLIYEGTINEDNFFQPEPLEEKVILRTHRSSYWDKLKHLTITPKEARKIGFPVSKALIDRGMVIANGTIQCATHAMEYGVSLNIAGGTHHSFTDRGEGFCVLNDIAIASNYLLDNGLSKKILIVDLDVHQGNGTAEIFRDEDRVFTFSAHGQNNYPLRKEKSDLDIGLADGMTDGPYLKTVKNILPKLIDEVMPDFIFYLSGVDIIESDKLGRLAVSQDGCRKRDKFVFETCRKNNIPVAVSMGGGYSEKIADIVEAHANTYRMARYVYF